MGIGGGEMSMRPECGSAGMRPAYYFFFFQDPTFGQPLQRDRITGLITEGTPRRHRGIARKGILRWSSPMIVIPVLTYTHVACPWIGHVK